MDRFTFRIVNIADIATATGLDAAQITLGTELDGSVTVALPTLTATQSADLKALFTDRGLIEDTGAAS